tara:strand:+ start:48 stop:467 length:420 start_codon:yes stop_codon:yes gene_type:complete
MLCTNGDDKFLREKTIWIVELSNGISVFQDDDRPGIAPASAWLRLKKYVEENSLFIAKLSIKFRSHTKKLPAAEQYHFAKGVGCLVGSEPDDYYIFGLLSSGVLTRKKFKVPEIILAEKTVVTDLDKYGPHMIKGNLNG